MVTQLTFRRKQRIMKEMIYKCIATFFYIGLFPRAQGTMGTVGAALLYAILWKFHLACFPVLFACLLVTSILNIMVGHWAEKHFQRKDPPCVVIDEVAGFFLTVCLFQPSFFVMLAGFALFRIFDISKPYPIRKLEKLKGGYGILLDDLAAACYAMAILILVSYIVHIQSWNIEVKPVLWNWKNFF